METGRARGRLSAESGSYTFQGAKWTPTSPAAGVRGLSESTRLSSLTHSEASHYGVGGRARPVGPFTLQPLSEPQLLSLRPTSLRTQDISHLLTSVFRNLYTNEVIGEDLCARLIKARGSEDARHEEFVDELQRVRRPPSPARPLPVLTSGVASADSAGEPRARPKKCRAPQDSAAEKVPAPAGCQAQGIVFDSLVEGHSNRTFP